MIAKIRVIHNIEAGKVPLLLQQVPRQPEQTLLGRFLLLEQFLQPGQLLLEVPQLEPLQLEPLQLEFLQLEQPLAQVQRRALPPLEELPQLEQPLQELPMTELIV